MKLIKLMLAAASTGGALLFQTSAIPLPLPPGGSTPLTPGVVGGPVVASLTSPFSNALYGGDVQSWVYVDPAWAGGLTFVYQIQLDPNVGVSLDEVHRLTTFGWAGFSSAVEQDPAAGDGGTTADRDAGPGNTVGFNIPAGFVEGENTALFIVRSDAPSWVKGIGAVIDGQSSNVEVLVPARNVPDGGTTAILLSLGVLAVGGVRRFASR